jgi:RHS repeat-associated protein
VAEIIWASVSWQWNRGYVYLGSQLLAVQYGGVYWMHEDPVTKSKRVTNSAGAIVSTIELDPWGADTNRSSNGAFQPKKFTSYERDANGTDEAMFRRYNRWQSRFDQPDPYDGSYSLTNPQSFNRYAYVQGDPVNFIDPTGLIDVITTDTWAPPPIGLPPGVFVIPPGAPGGTYVPGGIGGPGGGPGGTGTGNPQNPARDPSVLTGTVTNGPECDPDIIKAMKDAWQRAGIGTARTEAGFISYRGSDGKIGTANLPNTNQDKRISFRISDIIPTGATATAIYHTHPNSGSATPSTGGPPSDENTANRTGLPIYVISNRGLNAYDPVTGSRRARDGLDWQKPCK